MQAAAQPPAVPPPPPLPGAQLPPFVALSAVAAAIEESAKKLGCAKCRYSRGGCKRCRAPGFRPRGGAAAPAQPAAVLPDGQPKARRVVKGKRQRKGTAGQSGSDTGSEPLLHVLRRQLQGLHTQGSDAAGAAMPAGMPAAAAAAAPQAAAAEAQAAQAPAAGAAGAADGPSGAPQQQAAQQQKRAAEGGSEAAGQRPAKFFKADPLLVSNLQQQQQQQAPAAAPVAGQAAAAGPAGKREASSEPSPSARRPAKRLRAAHPLPLQPHGHIPAAPAPGAAEAEAAGGAAAAAAAAGAGGDADMAAAGAAPKRPAAEQRAQRPAKFRRVAHEQQVPPPLQQQQQQHQAAAGSPGSGGSEHMELDVLSPRKRAAAAALERAATGGASPAGAAFLAKLEEEMQLRHAARQQGAASPAANPLLQPASKRRKQASPAGGSGARSAPSPAASQGAAAAAAAAAAADGPDPRLCLWEPPVSPYGLLEEELFDDPWKLLVACMLLNKTSGAQVRKVIWELFALCPTPAAAIAADTAAISALIQPLGLFRKRAATIQQLSHDFLYQQWRDPTELYGIGKYAADAYHMFCRGRWREVQPDDKDLRRYREWLEQTGGLGTGLTRHRTMPAAAEPAGPASM